MEYRGARGGGACRDLAVFVDEVRIADPGSFYDMVPPGDIERMEILSVAEASAWPSPISAYVGPRRVRSASGATAEG